MVHRVELCVLALDLVSFLITNMNELFDNEY